MSLLAAFVFWLFVTLGAATDCPAPADQADAEIYVIQHSWHAGIAVPTDRLSEEDYPALAHFEDPTYVEIGWGDAGYYPHPDPGIGTTLKAGIWPTSSTLHVVGLHQHPRNVFPQTEVLRIPITEAALMQLISYMREAHVYDDGSPVFMTEGLYEGGLFFEAHESYHIFNNSNHWTARALESAGCPTDPGSALTVGQLLNQIRDFSEEME